MSFLTQPITLQSLFGKNREIGQITVQTILDESTNDTLTVTKQPVQQGASITDHSYKEPTTLSMRILAKNDATIGAQFSALVNTFSGGGLSELYTTFQNLQNDRIPFDIVTPKRVYRNMLMTVLRLNTDKSTENCLALDMSFQEVIIVNVVGAQVPRSRQKNPGATGATQKAGRKSALVSLKEGLGAFFR
jgi:hypothetical protein